MSNEDKVWQKAVSSLGLPGVDPKEGRFPAFPPGITSKTDGRKEEAGYPLVTRGRVLL